jgi:HprK-related kinase A
MILAQLAAAQVRQRLTEEGLCFRTGPFAVRLRSDVRAVHAGVALLYADHAVLDERAFCDFSLDLHRVAGVRRWLRPQVRIHHDHAPVFEPMPLGHAMPLLEWTLNWCVSSQAHQYLVVHAATIEREGRAAILAAPPGSGKSTLCAGLMHRGWRLLSDELALLGLGDGRLHALARPVSLKNRSIDVIRAYAPGSVFTSLTHDTAKGTVAHLKVPRRHLDRVDEPASPGWVIFPRYLAGAPARLEPRAKASTVLELGRNIFNFGVTGLAGYQALTRLVTASDCFDFSYGDLDDAAAAFDGLARQARP